MKKIIITMFTVTILSGCSLAEDLANEVEREVTNQIKDVVKEQFENIENEIDKKTAEKAGEITIDRVVDGDTFVSTSTGKEENYRLLLVDTPETVHPNKEEEPYGAEASAYTKERLEGQTVEIEFDQSERDQYGRLLVYVWIDGQLFNQELLQEGLAQVSVYPPNTRYVDEFEELEELAKEEEIGIWGL